MYVPEDCKTLEEAVKRVAHDPRITTIVVGEGVHQIDGYSLKIFSAMSIVGRPGVPKEKIVVVAGTAVFSRKLARPNYIVRPII
jgi:hypothetical protein